MSNDVLKYIDDEGIEQTDSLFLNTSIGDFNRLLQSTDYSVYSFTSQMVTAAGDI